MKATLFVRLKDGWMENYGSQWENLKKAWGKNDASNKEKMHNGYHQKKNLFVWLRKKYGWCVWCALYAGGRKALMRMKDATWTSVNRIICHTNNRPNSYLWRIFLFVLLNASGKSTDDYKHIPLAVITVFTSINFRFSSQPYFSPQIFSRLARFSHSRRLILRRYHNHSHSYDTFVFHMSEDELCWMYVSVAHLSRIALYRSSFLPWLSCAAAKLCGFSF